MKKHWKLFLAVVALCLCVALWPGKAYADTTAELRFELNEDGTAYTVTGGTNLEGEIVIPAEYNGLPVTEIRTTVFSRYCFQITSVVIPDSVTKIGDRAFESCFRLTEIELPDSVTEIGDYAFSGCSGLTEIELPNSVTEIGDYAFSWCTGLTELVIPQNVRCINGSAFGGCDALENVQVDEENAYYTTGSDGALYSKDMTRLVWVPYSVTDYLIPSSITSIGAGAFEDSPLSSIVIPDSVTAIGEGAFSSSAITTMTIPDSVTEIGDYAFSWCSGLTELVIPQNVRYIDGSTFYGCFALENVQVEEENAYYTTGTDGVLYSKDMTRLVWVPYSVTDYQIPSSITSIGACAFAYSPLSNIVIPDSVTAIGEGAFSSSAITTMTIPNSVTEIGNYAFDWCEQLTEIEIPDGITKISEGLFENCAALSSIVIPNSVTAIGEGAFLRSAITTMIIPDSVTEIGNYAFDWCEQLTEIKIPDGVTKISEGLFYGCAALSSIVIPDSVTEIDDYAFYNCTSLSSVAYGGTQEQWGSIEIGSENEILDEVYIRYSATSFALAYVKEWNMRISKDLTLIFYMVPLIEDENMQFEVTVGVEEKQVYSLSELNEETFYDGNKWFTEYQLPVLLTPTQLTAPIQIRALYDGKSDTMKSYSARLYCDTLIDEENQYCGAAEKILRYGSAVQRYFGDTTYGYADEGLEDYFTAGDDYYKYWVELNILTEGTLPVRYYGASLVFDNQLKIRFYFTGNVTDDLMYIYDGLGCGYDSGSVMNGNNVCIKNGYFYYDVPINLCYIQATGYCYVYIEDVGKIEITYSPMTYAMRMLSKDNLDPALEELLWSLIDVGALIDWETPK